MYVSNNLFFHIHTHSFMCVCHSNKNNLKIFNIRLNHLLFFNDISPKISFYEIFIVRIAFDIISILYNKKGDF